MVDFFGLHGMADIHAIRFAWHRPVRVRNQLGVFVEEGEEGQAGALRAELSLQRLAAGRIEPDLLGMLLHIDARNHEMPGEDGLDRGSLDKPIEALAPPSPGGSEQQEDVFVLCGGLSFGVIEHLLRGGRTYCCQSRNSNEQGD